MNSSRTTEHPRPAPIELTPEQTRLVAGGVDVEVQHNLDAVWFGVPINRGPSLH